MASLLEASFITPGLIRGADAVGDLLEEHLLNLAFRRAETLTELEVRWSALALVVEAGGAYDLNSRPLGDLAQHLRVAPALVGRGVHDGLYAVRLRRLGHFHARRDHRIAVERS